MRTAASSRWRRSGGRVARPCKPSSVPRLRPSGFSSRSRAAQQGCRARRSRGPWLGSRPSELSCYAYLQAFLEQVLVSVACNGTHSLKQRLGRWLLMMRDRSDDDALQITQSLLGEMLGVQRPTVTNVAKELERRRLDRARPAVGHDPRSARPRRGDVRMLSVGPGAHRFSPAQDLRVRSAPGRIGNLHYRQSPPTILQSDPVGRCRKRTDRLGR